MIVAFETTKHGSSQTVKTHNTIDNISRVSVRKITIAEELDIHNWETVMAAGFGGRVFVASESDKDNFPTEANEVYLTMRGEEAQHVYLVIGNVYTMNDDGKTIQKHMLGKESKAEETGAMLSLIGTYGFLLSQACGTENSLTAAIDVALSRVATALPEALAKIPANRWMILRMSLETWVSEYFMAREEAV